MTGRGKTARLNSQRRTRSDSLVHFGVTALPTGFTVLVNGQENTLTASLNWTVLGANQLAVLNLVL